MHDYSIERDGWFTKERWQKVEKTRGASAESCVTTVDNSASITVEFTGSILIAAIVRVIAK